MGGLGWVGLGWVWLGWGGVGWGGVGWGVSGIRTRFPVSLVVNLIDPASSHMLGVLRTLHTTIWVAQARAQNEYAFTHLI